ncbi:MAG: ABC transporter ATP-binding protein [Crocinitomicaceae bacterium]|nr:ABC transporter ATP-binding protein [Crocinitomicaceae bacterium]
MLKATGIQKAYGDLSILKGVDLTVASGEVISIVGSSGAGKTTLLQILGTLDRPDQGELLIDDINPFTLSSKGLADFRNKSIGFIFQFHQLLPEFTALENAMLPALIGGKSKKEAEERAQHLFQKLNIGHRTTHKPSELSGGEQQRVAVCRSLMNQPAVIFADEPSGNLDTKNAQELHELFFQLREEFKQTFVIVTHNESFAQMADRSLVMRDGNFI